MIVDSDHYHYNTMNMVFYESCYYVFKGVLFNDRYIIKFFLNVNGANVKESNMERQGTLIMRNY